MLHLEKTIKLAKGVEIFKVKFNKICVNKDMFVF